MHVNVCPCEVNGMMKHPGTPSTTAPSDGDLRLWRYRNLVLADLNIAKIVSSWSSRVIYSESTVILNMYMDSN